MERIRPADSDGNIISGNVLTYSCRNSLFEGGKKLIAAVGLEDLVVVDTEDATLICSKAHAGDIRKIVEQLKEQGEKYI